MRVLLLTDADVFAGTEKHMFDLAQGLKAEGVSVSIGSPAPSMLKDRSEAAGIPHVAIQKRGLIDREAIRQLKSMLRSREIDVVHAHNGRTMLSAAMSVSLAGAGYAIGTQHFLKPDHVTRRGAKAMVYHAAHRWVSGRLACHVAISEAVRDEMLDRREAPPDRIHVVHNGMPPIDRNRLKARDQVRSALGVSSDQLMILCAARLEREKNVSALIDAVARCDHPELVAFVAGAGSVEAALKERIADLDLHDSVKLLGFRDDVLSLIAACDLFVLPSLAEPFGLVLIEAMALGKPVIATDAGGPREIVVSGSTGLLVPPDDSTALAHAINTFVLDRHELGRMGERGLARFEEMFTAHRMTQGILAVYRSVLETAQRSAQ